MEGLEPSTFRVSGGRSTTELHLQKQAHLESN